MYIFKYGTPSHKVINCNTIIFGHTLATSLAAILEATLLASLLDDGISKQARSELLHAKGQTGYRSNGCSYYDLDLLNSFFDNMAYQLIFLITWPTLGNLSLEIAGESVFNLHLSRYCIFFDSASHDCGG